MVGDALDAGGQLGAQGVGGPHQALQGDPVGEEVARALAAWMEPMLTATACTGSVSRLASVCRARTTCAAATMASTPFGVERLLAQHLQVQEVHPGHDHPGRTATVPTGYSGKTCSASTASTAGRCSTPGLHQRHRARPEVGAQALLGRLEEELDRPAPAVAQARQRLRDAERHRHVGVVAADVAGAPDGGAVGHVLGVA